MGPDPTELSPPGAEEALPLARGPWRHPLWFLNATEPAWVLAAAAVANSAYLLQWDLRWAWVMLAVEAAPLVVRLTRRGWGAVRTPFDLPIALLLAGSLVGLYVSPDREHSAGTMLSLVADALAYYSFCSYRRREALLKVALALAAPISVAAVVLSLRLSDLPEGSLVARLPWAGELLRRVPTFSPPDSQPYLFAIPSHGAVLTLALIALVAGGVALFGRPCWLRIATAVVGAVFLLGALASVDDALARLVTGLSLDTRSEMWRGTLDRLGRHPLWGLGLGSWAVRYNEGRLLLTTTHPHNAYLQLYSDAGLLGLASLVAGGVVVLRLGGDLLRAGRAGGWFGVGVGVLAATAFSALVGLVESSPAGIPLRGPESYFYIVSPLPWVLAALLVVSWRLRGVPARPVAPG